MLKSHVIPGLNTRRFHDQERLTELHSNALEFAEHLPVGWFQVFHMITVVCPYHMRHADLLPVTGLHFQIHGCGLIDGRANVETIIQLELSGDR